MEQSGEQYLHWLRQAAESGSASAQYDLAMCYKKGTGVERNEEQYLHWLRRARLNRSMDARWELERYNEA